MVDSSDADREALLPNLAALLATLDPSSSSGKDAAELALAAAEGSSWTDVDAALDAIVERWVAL